MREIEISKTEYYFKDIHSYNKYPWRQKFNYLINKINFT